MLKNLCSGIIALLQFLCENSLPFKETWSVLHTCSSYVCCVCVYLLKWRAGQPPLNCSHSAEQDVPESGFHLLVLTCCHVACKLFTQRQYMRAWVSAECYHSHCWMCFFNLQYLMLCECQMHFFWFVDKQPSVFFTSLHRTKQTQRQNLARTRFCLRAHGYVID